MKGAFGFLADQVLEFVHKGSDESDRDFLQYIIAVLELFVAEFVDFNYQFLKMVSVSIPFLLLSPCFIFSPKKFLGAQNSRRRDPLLQRPRCRCPAVCFHC